MGVLGARLCFVILFAFALITWIWRSTSKNSKRFHEEGAGLLVKYEQIKGERTAEVSSSKQSCLDNKRISILAFFFAAISDFYMFVGI